MDFSQPTGLGGQNYTLPGVPSYFLRVLNDLETEKLPFNWTLQKNVEGYSLSLKFPANPLKPHKNRHFGNVNKDTQPRKQEHSKSSSAVPNRPPIHRADVQRRKSPSCRRRDRNRRVSWRRRKKSPTPRPLETELPRGTDANPSVLDSLPVTGPVLSGNTQEGTDADPKVQDSLPIVIPRENHPHNQPTQRQRETITDTVSKYENDFSRSESETSQKPEDIIVNDTTEHSLDSSNSSVVSEFWYNFADCYLQDDDATAHLNEGHEKPCVPDYGDINFVIKSCSYCSKSDFESELKTCSRCKGVRYCSRACQAAHWKEGHKKLCIAV